MSKVVTIGGDRLGAGKKMKQTLHGWSRSNHDIGRVWASTISPGTLVPFLVEPGTLGTTFDTIMKAVVRTQPSVKALYGSYKLQLDLFETKTRYYHPALHYNQKDRGLMMDKLFLPTRTVTTIQPDPTLPPNRQQINTSSLLHYLGKAGYGRAVDASGSTLPVGSTFNVTEEAIEELIYWDIYNEYYANPAEKMGYAISHPVTVGVATLMGVTFERVMIAGITYPYAEGGNGTAPATGPVMAYRDVLGDASTWSFRGTGLTPDKVIVKVGTAQAPYTTIQNVVPMTLTELVATGRFVLGANGPTRIDVVMTSHATDGTLYGIDNSAAGWASTGKGPINNREVNIVGFPLKNIDDLRANLLKQDIATPFNIDSNSPLPYGIGKGMVTDQQGTSVPGATWPMCGLGLKTYQNDRFNSFIAKDWQTGAEGINEIAKVNVVNNAVYQDDLILGYKVFKMLTRVAIAGNTYDDWAEVQYDEKIDRHTEMPRYMGGMSARITFDEVVNTADGGNDAPLGSLGGRGTVEAKDNKNGHVRIKLRDNSIIMGILSITPYLFYDSGNKWWTRLETFDDWHKPALDGLPFQELLTDEFAAFDTTVSPDGTKNYNSVGLQPSWTEYTTAVNEAHGNFAFGENQQDWILQRRYDSNQDGLVGFTTYIDPELCNTTFAQRDLTAQNFMVLVGMDITARRKMSHKQMPLL